MADKRLCSIEGCDKPAKGRGWCDKHWSRWRRNGHPLAGKTFEGAPMSFLTGVVNSPPDDCALWTFAKDRDGYGMLHVGKAKRMAHREAWERYNGRSVGAGLIIAHSPNVCHNPSCINPLHLREATHLENQDDRILDDTHTNGERHPSSKLTADDVRAIRLDRRMHRAIAMDYSITPSTVSKIKRRIRWKWLS